MEEFSDSQIPGSKGQEVIDDTNASFENVKILKTTYDNGMEMSQKICKLNSLEIYMS